MIHDFKNYLFGKKNLAYEKSLFAQNKNTLTFGLFITFVISLALLMADYFYYKSLIPEKSFQAWVLSPTIVFRSIFFPIFNLGLIFLSSSSWNNSTLRSEGIGSSVILMWVLAIFHMSISNEYISPIDFGYEILPLIVFTQMLYGLSFKSSFYLNLTVLLFILFYSMVQNIAFEDFFWIYTLLISTWVSMLIGTLKLEQSRIASFTTISKLEATNAHLATAQKENREQKHLLRAGEKVNKMFSWKSSKDLKNIEYSNGVFDILEIDKSVQSFKGIYKIMLQRFHPDDKEMVFQQIANLSKNINMELKPYRIILPDGTMKWLKTTVEDMNEEFFLYGTIQDITREKMLELKLQNHAQELKARNEDLQQFAYASSHDLQEPLRTITNFVEILNKKLSPQLTPEYRTYMNLVLESTQRMSDLIRAILDYSRIGKDENMKDFDCNTIVKNVEKDLNFSLEQAQGKIITANPLPVIFGYPVEFSTMLQNLIGNALKFRKAEEKPIIIIRSHSDQEAHHFCVEDNGIGMEQKYANKIFHLFARLHAKEQYDGTGIGLTHCKKIVELHGGKIWVESVVGQGTTFHFYISKNLKNTELEKESQLQLVDY